MEKTLPFLAASILLLSCSQQKKADNAEADTESEEVVEYASEEEVSTPENEAELVLDGYDVVEYFEEGPVKGVSEYSSVHGGKTYYFSSADNLATFEAEPEKFTPQYGGWCAYGMSKGGKFPADPETYKIVDNKLLVFYNDGQKNTKESWDVEDEQELIENADDNWGRISVE